MGTKINYKAKMEKSLESHGSKKHGKREKEVSKGECTYGWKANARNRANRGSMNQGSELVLNNLRKVQWIGTREQVHSQHGLINVVVEACTDYILVIIPIVHKPPQPYFNMHWIV